MTNDQIDEMECQITLAKNLFRTPMVFEGGDERPLIIDEESFQLCQMEVIDHFFPETDVSFMDWSAIPDDTQ